MSADSPRPISRRQALDIVLDSIQPAPETEVSPWKALFMVTSRDVDCPCDLPDHAHSVRDGYTLPHDAAAAATPDQPACFKIERTICAHNLPGPPPSPGACIRVLTGGRIPEGCDTVVADEESVISGGLLRLETPPSCGKFIKPAGAFMRKGDRLLDRGTAVLPPASAAMVRAGIPSIGVHQPVTVSLLSLGDELADPHSSPPGHLMRRGKFLLMPADNLILVEGLLRRYGAGLVNTAVRGDDPEQVAEFLANNHADLTVTMGGTGRSEKDMTKRAAESTGFELGFESVAFSPGRGVFFGTRNSGKTPEAMFGLPGPPSAVFAAFHALVLPALLKLRGLRNHRPEEEYAVLDRPARAGKGGERLVCCELGRQDGRLAAHPLGKNETGSMEAMIRARGLIACPRGDVPKAAGEEVPVVRFPGPDGYGRGEE